MSQQYDNTNSGVLFKNDEKKNEKSPEYTGKINIEGKEYKLSAWVKEGKKGKFFSLKVNEFVKKENEAKAVSDDLPF